MTRQSDTHPLTAAVPAAAPVLKTSARGAMALGLVFLLALFGAGGAWGYFAQLSGAVIAHGRVNVVGEPKTVQHLDGGVVDAIAVRSGDSVSAGQVLLRLDDALLSAAREVHEGRLIELVALRSRLLAERSGATGITWLEAPLEPIGLALSEEVRQSHQELLETRRATVEGQISLLDERIKRAENQLAGAQAQAQSIQRRMALVDEELAGVQSLDERGLTTTNRLMVLRREAEELGGRIAQIESEIEGARNVQQESVIQQLQTRRQFQETVLQQLRETEQSIASTSFDLRSTHERLERIEIRAPVAGIVHELSVATIGAVIAPGETLMQIIPQDGDLEVIGRVEPQFIDDLFPEQPAALRFAAFDMATTPELEGTLATISPDVLVDERTGFATYEVRVHVSPEELERLGGRAIIPGMPVDMFITTQPRSMWEYFSKPLTDQLARAFREP